MLLLMSTKPTDTAWRRTETALMSLGGLMILIPILLVLGIVLLAVIISGGAAGAVVGLFLLAGVVGVVRRARR